MHASDSDLVQLRRLEPTDAYFAPAVERGSEVLSLGPFRLLFSPATDVVSFSEAVPVDALGSDEDVVATLQEMRHLFEERQRPLTVEFNEPLWPRLPVLLEAAGLIEQVREPLMLCTPADFVPFSNPDVLVRFLSSSDDDADFIAYQSIFSEILLSQRWEPTREAVDRFREQAGHSGGLPALAFLQDQPVGTGFISPFAGISEINRVATVTAARRRGVAATLTSFMMSYRFNQGDSLAWLTAADDAAQALYVKLGFRVVGNRLYYGT